MKQQDLLVKVFILVEFYNKFKPRTIEGRGKKKILMKMHMHFMKVENLILNAFKSGIFLIKAKKGEGLKIPTPKQMIQRLPIALAQVKASNTSENLLNEIRQIIYPLYRAKEITKKLYNNIMNLIKKYG